MNEKWWHYSVALPLGRDDHAYHVLRRIWADHTMPPPRGYWARGSEDYLTTVLFQPLASLTGVGWLDFLLVAAGLKAVDAQETRFAFFCEEVLDASLLPRHGRNFVIADIMLNWRNGTEGLVAFEAKKPKGLMPTAQDVTKLETYAMLPSTRGIPVRQGVFLVDDVHVAVLKRGGHAALGWSMVHLALITGLNNEAGSDDEIGEIAQGLTRLFKSAGVSVRNHPPPRGSGGSLPLRLQALLKGIRVREAVLRGEEPNVPFEWLANEPSRDEIPQFCFQSRMSRRVNRWSLNWSVDDEV